MAFVSLTFVATQNVGQAFRLKVELTVVEGNVKDASNRRWLCCFCKI
jgi:hypothetical protein